MLPVIATVRRSGPPPRVLLLADVEPLLSSAATLLEERGYEVVRCDHLVRARHLLEDRSFDVVVVGPHMDPEAVRGVIAEARGARERLPIVILSEAGTLVPMRFTAWVSLPALPAQIAKTVIVACPRTPAAAQLRRL
jgi:hypothetical protein